MRHRPTRSTRTLRAGMRVRLPNGATRTVAGVSPYMLRYRTGRAFRVRGYTGRPLYIVTWSIGPDDTGAWSAVGNTSSASERWSIVR